jgi:uncharacterized protein YycO/cell division protein FtsB
MIKKMRGLTIAIVLTTSLLGSDFVFAKDQKLSYDELMRQLETIKQDIQEKSKLTILEKEKISKDSHELVNQFLKDNRDLDNEKQFVLLNSLKDIDGLMYNVAIEKGNANFGSKSGTSIFTQSNDNQNFLGLVSTSSTTWSGRGDILISLEAKTYGLPHGHAGILSDKKDYVIEALPSPGVVHHSAEKYWSTVDDEGQYYVKNAKSADYQKAVDYAKAQVGEPYKLKTTLGNTSEWYCSKLVFKAWESAGFQVGSLDEYLGVVLPGSIIADWDTVKYINNPY